MAAVAAAAAVERHMKFSVASLQLSVQYISNSVNSAKTAKTANAVVRFGSGFEGVR